MKLAINIILFLSTMMLFESNSFSLTNYEINKICKEEKKELTCIKNLREKRYKLQKGNYIEIPVIPYKR